MPADVAIAGPVPAEKDYAPPGPLLSFWRAFRENRGAVIGLSVIGAIVLIAIFAPWIAPYSPIEQFKGHFKQPPVYAMGGSWDFILGTDDVGRDLLSRIIFGSRISLFIGLSVMLVSVAIGLVLGLLSAFAGGILDVAVQRVMDLIMSIPDLVLAILLVAVLGQPSLTNTIIAITVVFLPRYVLLIRASALAEMKKEYVTASRVAGAGPLRIMLSTVLPNCMAPLIVQGALGVSDAILEAAGLGFLGLGARPPTPEWGAMLADAREFVQASPWIVTFPGLAILITVLAINLTGDGLRDALDPKLRKG